MWPPESEKPEIATLVALDFRQRAGEMDRGLPVGVLFADSDDLPVATTALPETGGSRRRDREPGLVEPLGELIGTRLLVTAPPPAMTTHAPVIPG